jgi:hypothetical protein
VRCSGGALTSGPACSEGNGCATEGKGAECSVICAFSAGKLLANETDSFVQNSATHPKLSLFINPSQATKPPVDGWDSPYHYLFCWGITNKNSVTEDGATNRLKHSGPLSYTRTADSCFRTSISLIWSVQLTVEWRNKLKYKICDCFIIQELWWWPSAKAHLYSFETPGEWLRIFGPNKRGNNRILVNNEELHNFNPDILLGWSNEGGRVGCMKLREMQTF